MSGLGIFVTKSYNKTPVKQKKEAVMCAKCGCGKKMGEKGYGKGSAGKSDKKVPAFLAKKMGKKPVAKKKGK